MSFHLLELSQTEQDLIENTGYCRFWEYGTHHVLFIWGALIASSLLFLFNLQRPVNQRKIEEGGKERSGQTPHVVNLPDSTVPLGDFLSQYTAVKSGLCTWQTVDKMFSLFLCVLSPKQLKQVWLLESGTRSLLSGEAHWIFCGVPVASTLLHSRKTFWFSQEMGDYWTLFPLLHGRISRELPIWYQWF